MSSTIKKISHYVHMQILYHNCPGSNIGPYITIHFFYGVLHIYDSLNVNHLDKDIITYTDRLFANLNSNIYIKECMEKRLLPFVESHNQSVLFRPDLASCHYSKTTLSCYL